MRNYHLLGTILSPCLLEIISNVISDLFLLGRAQILIWHVMQNLRYAYTPIGNVPAVPDRWRQWPVFRVLACQTSSDFIYLYIGRTLRARRHYRDTQIRK